MENEEKKLQQEYAKFFDEVFEKTDVHKHIDLSNVPLLSVIYDRLKEDVCMESPKSEALRRRQDKIFDELQKGWTQEQIDLFEEYCDLTSKMEIEMERQNFIFGVLISAELDREIKSCKSAKDKK